MRISGAISDPTLAIGVLTDAGRSGKNNEDDYVVFETISHQENGTVGAVTVQVLVVADGIGGNVAGEMASDTAARTIHDAFTANVGQRVRQRLVEAIYAANHNIYQQTLARPELVGMGTTVVAAAVAGDQLYVAHAGDSRAYLIRNGKAHQLTLDHTWAQEAIEAGRLSPAEAREHPNRHVIKRFLGIAPTVDVDTTMVDLNRGTADPDQLYEWPKTDQLTLQPTDILLLCSDGLTDVVTDKQIEQVATRYGAQEAARRLVDMANQAGGPDNITVVMMKRQSAGALASERSSRSPMLALLLALLVVVMGGGAWYILQGGATPPDTVADQGAADTVAAAVITPTATTAAVVAPTLTIPATATEAPSATPSATPLPTPLPMGIATEIATEIATPTLAAALASTAFVTNSTAMTATTAVALARATTPGVVGEGASPAATAIQTRPPTSTPVADSTDTPTPTPTPTPPPTRAATATVLGGEPPPTPRSSQVAGVPVSIPANARVTLEKPEAGDTLNSKRLFTWKANFSLPDDYAFEPVFWRPNEEPLKDGKGYAGYTTVLSLNIDSELFRKDGSGEYYWGVLLVQVIPEYRRINYLGDSRRVIIDFAGSNSGPGGGSSSGGGSRDDG
ncbi:MAG: PP2C family serine/threonine-protein phosphatase [Caldilineaceae bacterium]